MCQHEGVHGYPTLLNYKRIFYRSSINEHLYLIKVSQQCLRSLWFIALCSGLDQPVPGWNSAWCQDSNLARQQFDSQGKSETRTVRNLSGHVHRWWGMPVKNVCFVGWRGVRRRILWVYWTSWRGWCSLRDTPLISQAF